jgi:predicted RNA-binding Zn ribbon-like protein
MAQPGGRAAAPAHLQLAQDLPNTIDVEMGRDVLVSVADLERFAAAHGVSGRFRSDDVRCFRELREAIRAICAGHAGAGEDEAAVALLNAQLARAPLLVQATSSRELTIATTSSTGATALLARLAAGIATAHQLGDWTRLKACDAHSCRWVYYDRSPGNRSRWCTMSICGSREKVRAYRARARTS